MSTIGIICEYNPFHNGHLYHINKIKEMYPDSTIVLVMSGNFTQRGDASIINKWDKTEIALKNNIDLVVELPFKFTCESADIFAYGAVNILNYLKVDTIIFGSETNDIDKFNKIANVQLSKEYNLKVKEYVSSGINYATSLSKALNDFGFKDIKNPNDILAISYIRELNKINSKITPISIKRDNDYNSKELTDDITSATSIRENIKTKDIKKYVPSNVYPYLDKKLYFIEDYYPLLKYKILSEDNLSKYVGVDEGIDNKIKKVIYNSNSYEELIMNIKSKRYTYTKIKRILLSILIGFEKDDLNLNIDYIRVLGFNKKGRIYLNKVKKEIDIPIYTNFKKEMNLELKVTSIYDINLIKKEISGLIKTD